MKIGVMQPYLFPYIGYWQLINAVDKFVILDDVNYIMRGYINRNTILLNGKLHKFTIPMKKASQNKLIMDTELAFIEEDKKRFLATITTAYKRAPYYGQVYPMLEKIVCNDEADLTAYIQYSLETIAEYLQLDTVFLRSSQIDKDSSLRAQDRIVAICKQLDADIYINPCGGRSLYNHEAFARESMQLRFLDTRTEQIKYQQNQDNFEKNLSIIDVLMFNDVDTIKRFLEEYDLNE